MSVDARIAGNVYSLPGQIVSFTAGAAITKGQPVYISGDMTVSPAGDASHPIIGVAVTNQATVGKQVSVLMGCPIVYMIAGATISAGLWVTASYGKVVAADTQPRAVDEAGSATYTFAVSNIIGVNLEAAAGDTAVIRVAVMQHLVCLTPND
jgi:predicted RecA/RadA family phage recombinase